MLHLLLLLTAFLLLSVPLRHLTGSVRAQEGHTTGKQASVVEGAEEHPEGEHSHRLPVRVRLRFAHPPEEMMFLAGEKDLLEGVEKTVSPIEVEVELELGHEGNEFVLEGRWKDDAPDTAVTVEMEPDGLDMRAETRWSEGGAISDVLTFVW